MSVVINFRRLHAFYHIRFNYLSIFSPYLIISFIYAYLGFFNMFYFIGCATFLYQRSIHIPVKNVN